MAGPVHRAIAGPPDAVGVGRGRSAGSRDRPSSDGTAARSVAGIRPHSRLRSSRASTVSPTSASRQIHTPCRSSHRCGSNPYFGAAQDVNLATVPVPGNRSCATRYASSCCRVRLIRSTSAPPSHAVVSSGPAIRRRRGRPGHAVRRPVDHGLFAETDDRGEFAVVFPRSRRRTTRAADSRPSRSSCVSSLPRMPAHDTATVGHGRPGKALVTEIEFPGI